MISYLLATNTQSLRSSCRLGTMRGRSRGMDKSFNRLGEAARCGLARMLLRLPASQREALRLAAACRPPVDEMLGAYEEACLALERFRREDNAEPTMVFEYEELCRELENDVMWEVFGVPHRK
ncbi:conserved hypothetical protein [Rhizobium mesoamericanum STM3625]|uniref:Uncharacterized protein n=1 Tax=Rhizobium mesoamericanum STM3625 TaxID=1211777 RepID=K0Q4L6_9HYPH|nr:conserved hypothetical protein [Rhizobium mesoamericanum STM3625]